MSEDDHKFEKSKTLAWVVIGSSFVGTVGLIFPFLWMQLKSPLPYMSTPRKKVILALEEISRHRQKKIGNNSHQSSCRLKYYDLGSGDGETVLTAASLPGWNATGIELNFTLWSISNIRRLVLGTQTLLRSGYPIQCPTHKSNNIFCTSRFLWADFWSVPIKEADAVMIFGVSPLMPRIADKIQNECQPGTFVLAYRFKLPIISDFPNVSNEKSNLLHLESLNKVISGARENIDYQSNNVEKLSLRPLNASLIYDIEEMRIYKLLGGRDRD